MATARRIHQSTRGQGARKDPQPRHMRASTRWNDLENKDPKKVYYYSLRSCAYYGPSYFRALGFEVENYREGGVKPRGARLKPGDEIEMQGHLLMSIPKEEWESIKEYGPDGDGGLAREKQREELILKSRAGFDPMRGSPSPQGVEYLPNRTSELVGIR